MTRISLRHSGATRHHTCSGCRCDAHVLMLAASDDGALEAATDARNGAGACCRSRCLALLGVRAAA
jgi:hypothetical protein